MKLGIKVDVSDYERNVIASLTYAHANRLIQRYRLTKDRNYQDEGERFQQIAREIRDCETG